MTRLTTTRRPRLALALAGLALAGLCACSDSGRSSSFTARVNNASASSNTSNSSASSNPSTGGAPTASPATASPADIPFGPIVLVHGVDATQALNPAHTSNHFTTLPQLFRDRGAEVLVVKLSGLQSIEVRARELEEQILLAYPDPNIKLNLIAHSFGGLDSRYLISRLGYGDRIASLTTISTPHHGTPLADIILRLVPGPVERIIDALANLFGIDWDVVLNASSEFLRDDFNPNTPDDPRVYYQSYAGFAQPGGDGLTVGKLRSSLNFTWLINRIFAGDNDGTIPVSSSQWGDFKGTIPADHGGALGQYSDKTDPSNFEHEPFFLTVLADLAARGF